MTIYNVSVKETLSFSEEAKDSSSLSTDLLEINETVTGQDQLTKEIVTFNETFGVPIFAMKDLIVFNEQPSTYEQWLHTSEYIQINDTFDTSGSVLSNPVKYSETFSINETVTSQMTYNVIMTEQLAFFETFHFEQRFDYKTSDKYYYTPR